MTENVNIVGVGSNQNPPMWATEESLKRLYDLFNKDHKVNKDTAKVLEMAGQKALKDGKISQKLLDNIIAELKDNTKVQEEAAKEIAKKTSDALKKHSKDRSKDEKALVTQNASVFQALTSDISKHTGSFTDNFVGKLGGKFDKLGDTSDILKARYLTAYAGLGLLTSAIGYLTGKIVASVDSYNQLFENGVAFNESIGDIVQAQGAAGLSLETLTSVVSENSALFTLSSMRLKDFANQSKTLTLNMADYNLTLEQGAEYYADYLDSLRRFGVFENLTNAQRRIAAEENIKQLTRLSAVMGKSREQILKDANQMLDSADLNAKLTTLPASVRSLILDNMKTASQAFASFDGGEALGAMMTDMLAAPVAEASSSYQDLLKVSPELANQMLNLSKRMQSGSITSDQFNKEIQNMGSIINANADNINIRRLSPELKELANTVLGAKFGIDQYNDAVKKQTPEGEALAKAMTSLSNKSTALLKSFDTLVGKIIVKIEPYLIKFADGLIAGVESVSKFIDWFSNDSTTLAEKIFDPIFGVMEFAAGVLKSYYTGIFDLGKAYFAKIGQVLEALGTVGGMIIDGWSMLGSLVWDTLSNVVDSIVDSVSKWIDQIFEKVTVMFNDSIAYIATSVERMIDSVVSFVKKLPEMIFKKSVFGMIDRATDDGDGGIFTNAYGAVKSYFSDDNADAVVTSKPNISVGSNTETIVTPAARSEAHARATKARTGQTTPSLTEPPTSSEQVIMELANTINMLKDELSRQTGEIIEGNTLLKGIKGNTKGSSGNLYP